MDLFYTSVCFIEAARRERIREAKTNEECMVSHNKRNADVESLRGISGEIEQEIKKELSLSVPNEARLKRLKEIQANIKGTLSRCR
jgi:hypothetical protein